MASVWEEGKHPLLLLGERRPLQYVRRGAPGRRIGRGFGRERSVGYPELATGTADPLRMKSVPEP